MKKALIFLVFLLTAVTLLAACKSQTRGAPPATLDQLPSSAAAAVSAPTTSSPAIPPAASLQPRYGGILKVVALAGPQMLGYAPEMSVTDQIGLFPVLERLMDYSDDRGQGSGWEPVLAEKVDDDIANKRIVFHLRPGVKFQDGSELNADVVIWNFQQLVNTKTLNYLSYWQGIRKLDDLTVQIDYTEYNNRLLQWGHTAIYSQQAWEMASGGNLEKGKEWAREHVVGTGPFMLQEYKRDNHMYFVRNPQYWIPGKPYLDGIQTTFIPYPATARTMMLSGEANYWFGAPNDMQKEMVEKGFNGPVSWFGLPMSIWPNTADPVSKWNDIRLRQAVEYALDKKTIADRLGFGYFTPLTTMAPPTEWGYDPNYPARNYDPSKARQLLSEAGYAGGLSAKLLISSDSVDAGVTLKGYLDAAGFQIELDVADPGRFYGTVFGPVPGPDLVFCFSGTDITEFGSYMDNLSSYPGIKNSYLGHPAEQKALDDEALKIPDTAGQKAMTGRLVKYIADNVRVIPVYWATGSIITPTYVHPLQTSNGGFRWHSEDVWLDNRRP